MRQLSLRGFKSFADKTALEFVPGVSVIVGPNGSGKSNLVDAISWVLGEQGPRALRGGQMADVIFAGSPARQALGMAEVKLVIDNSAGLIPVPLSEIEISRAIFRSGESEYRIGGQIVRLLDVQELLSESGIGRALHTVVGQGQLEEVLHSRPEDRRRYIEEAAGIAKHRLRKERAHRKLSGLEQDLLRLQDVLAELKRQLKPLRQQAESAKRHEELTAQADELAWRLAAARLRDLLSDRERRRSGWDQGLELRTKAREWLEALDERVATAGGERERRAAELWSAEAALQEAQAEKSAAELALRLAVESESSARTELGAEATRAARMTHVADEMGELETALHETARSLAERETELEEAEERFRVEEAARREIEEERRRHAEEQAARRAEAETVRRSLEAYERERGRIDESLAEVRGRIEVASSEREALQREIERLDAQATPLAERKSKLELERGGLADAVAEIEEALRRHVARRDLLVARRADLEETPGSRFLQAHRGRAVGLLRELVEAEPGLERALAAALGPFADAVVYERGADAVADAPEGDGAVLAIAQGGPVAFILPGERSLLSAVSVDAAARGLVSTLLRDVYLVGSLPEAVEKQETNPKASFVTREGMLVGPATIRTTAEGDDRLRALRDELGIVEHDLAASRRRLKDKSAQLEDLVRETGELLAAIEASDAELTAAAEGVGARTSDLASLAKEEEVLVQRLAGLDDAAGAWRESLSIAPSLPEPPQLPPAPESPIRARVAVESARRERSALEARLQRLLEERAALDALDAGALRAALEEAERAHAAANERVADADGAYETASTARNAAASAEREATEAEAAINRDWREAAHELERLREEYEDEDRARGDLERRIRDAERLLREGHSRDPAEALAALGDEESVTALDKRSELVQRRLALLGRVNLLATGEFEQVQERHDFMARELDDVRKARRDLLEVIQRIDEEITATFDAAYRDVAREFEALFADLFPGGEGRLLLTDPTDLLASGIEVEARPGRKRVKRISLLSGGERALTALAFLFSIFRARPSPFYLLDEVEPALDDVNLQRFLKLIQGFARESQVLVVTHQKRTMEVAEMMYGVSMSKEGTSRVVCQRLDHPNGEPVQGNGAGTVEPRTIALPESDVVH